MTALLAGLREESGVFGTSSSSKPTMEQRVEEARAELLGNIAAQLTVEFEETVDTWHPAGKVTLPQLTLTACPGYGPP